MRTRSFFLFVSLAGLSCQEVNPSGVTDESGGSTTRGVRPTQVTSTTEEELTKEEEEPLPAEADEAYELPAAKCSFDGRTIVTLINAHRSENGEVVLPESASLCLVAEAHVGDLIANAPYEEEGCEAKSWSDAGPWEACCYLPDNSNPECMWDKPQELFGFEGEGYEVVAIHAGGVRDVVEAWLEDPGLEEMILSRGAWEGTEWSGIGAAIVDGHATLWLGDGIHPE